MEKNNNPVDEKLPWLTSLRRQAEEIYEHGEGELVFQVYQRPPDTKIHWRIEIKKVERSK